MSIIVQKNSSTGKSFVFSTAGIEPATIQCDAWRLQSYALPTELSREMTIFAWKKQSLYTVERIFSTSFIMTYCFWLDGSHRATAAYSTTCNIQTPEHRRRQISQANIYMTVSSLHCSVELESNLVFFLDVR